MSTISVKTLVEAGAHYGHKTRKWHPAMKEYIYGAQKGIHILDARLSLQKLKEAYNFVSGLASKGGKILFVGTKAQAQIIMKEQGERSDCFYVSNRWLGGTMTNFSTIRRSIAKLNDLDQLAGEDGTYPGILKKEAVRYERLRQKMLSNLGGIREMRKHPAALFVVDIRYEDIAIKEAKTLGIPVIAIVDTNADPNVVEYPIPGNDDSVKTIELYASIIASAHLVGREIFDKHSTEEQKEGSKDEEKKKASSKEKAEDAKTKPAAKAKASPKKEEAPAPAEEVASEVPKEEAKASEPEAEPTKAQESADTESSDKD